MVNKVIISILVACIGVLLMVNNFKQTKIDKTSKYSAQQELVIDSLKNSNIVYDSLLHHLVTDTNRINLKLSIKMTNTTPNTPIIEKEKKHLFNLFKNK